MLKLAVSLTAFLLLAGCASSHIITGKTRAPINPSEVRIYSHAPKQFEEIAIIEASSKNSWAFGDQGKIDAVIDRLKTEAANLGANGVLLEGTGSESTGGVVMGGVGRGTPAFGTGIYTTALHKTGRARAIYVSE